MATPRPQLLPEDTPNGAIPPLAPGERLTSDEFHRRYEAMPQLKKAELIEAVVHMPSPVRYRRHGWPSRHLSGWLAVYEAATPGVEGADNTTIRLDLDNEPQPDALLLIDPARGGQARISEDDYIVAAPELVAEVAASSVRYDLNTKLTVYQRSGVRECLVWRVDDHQVDWFVLRGARYEPLARSDDGVLRSEVFPGLWLNADALTRGDLARVLAVLQDGLRTTEHVAFVGRLNPGG
ncbi:MAG: Uma2 family endonuclease [Gemmataceae bacterium]|nr:Uma2 family endonuclease [Gemmataceae bacterium]